MNRIKEKPIHITNILFKEKTFELILNAHKNPIIKCGSDYFKNMEELITAFPDLAKPENLYTLAEACNFMFKGLEFSPINDVEEFKSEYMHQIKFEQTQLELMGPRLSDYGIYDVSVMHQPRLLHSQFIFFVMNAYNRLPFRVICALPLSRDYPSVRYELLPYEAVKK